MLIWLQRQGRLLGKVSGVGYSGYAEHKNDPASEAIEGLGPIPVGAYKVWAPHDDKDHGPFVLSLSALPGTNTHGRSGFLIHGDSLARPGCASHGCIILPRSVREQIAASGEQQLIVLHGDEEIA